MHERRLEVRIHLDVLRRIQHGRVRGVDRIVREIESRREVDALPGRGPDRSA